MTAILLTSGILILLVGGALMWTLEMMIRQLADDGSLFDDPDASPGDKPGVVPLPPHLREESEPASAGDECPICGQRHRGRSALVNGLPVSEASLG